jgi:hypothetical protein
MNITRLSLASLAFFPISAFAQSIPFNGTYEQGFDGLASTGFLLVPGKGPHAIEGILGSTGVPGWSASNFTGSSADTEFRAQDGSLGSSAGRGVIFFGTTGSTERALGCLPTSNQISGFGIVLLNDTGATIDALTVKFTGEQWRRGNATLANSLTFAYGLAPTIGGATTLVPELEFISPNMQAAPTEVALDGNDPANQKALEATLDGLAWPAGESLALVWKIQDFSGQDNGLAIDGLSITAATSACYPDCDASGNLNIDDFICFQTFFAIGDPYADCDASGNLNIDDFICFQTFYAIGC